MMRPHHRLIILSNNFRKGRLVKSRYRATRSLPDIDRCTVANDPQSSTSFSARNNPQCIPVNTLPVFLGLRPRIWPRLLRLVTKAISDRLLGVGLLTRWPHESWASRLMP